ncbi:MAG: hypothetical protein RLO81_08520, partial [Fulvivirga sp.]|uniref:hypothetical protein n=1 Tax=Fulvivirga sp. TaxID=1931237 RepID=UPI0032EDBE9D
NDFFIKQSINAESGGFSSNTISSGESGYTLYTVGGVIGSQFSYDIGENYSLAIQPQYKQMLNSFTPEGNRVSSFEVGFRFNYRLK